MAHLSGRFPDRLMPEVGQKDKLNQLTADQFERILALAYQERLQPPAAGHTPVPGAELPTEILNSTRSRGDGFDHHFFRDLQAPANESLVAPSATGPATTMC
jgi:hypothetical protein